MKIHSYFSLKYGVYAPEKIIEWAKESGYYYVFLADINSTGAVLSFVRAAQNVGIHPLVGLELKNGMKPIATIMAKNNRGIHEMNVFLSEHLHLGKEYQTPLPHFSNCYIFYYVDAGIQRKLYEHEYYQISLTQLKQWEFKYQKQYNESKVVLLEPMIFKSKRDFNTHRLLRAIHNNILLSKLNVAEQAIGNEYFLSKKEFECRCEPHISFWNRTLSLFEKSQINYRFGDDVIPQNPAFYTGSKEEDEQLLRQLCAEGLSYRYSSINDEIVARIEKEIGLISQKDYLSYFLIAWDFTSYARSKNFFYVGRGSGANSIVAYLLRITDVDPLELDLYFERFINLYRKNPPDFDIDFSWKDRADVVRYIFTKYPHSAWLCTYNTFQYRATVRELGKVFGLPKSDIDKISKRSMPLEQMDSLAQLVMRYATYIQGMPSYLSVHSGGIVISERPITWFSATFIPPNGFQTTQFSMLEAEDVGLYKFDVLSQRGLGKIRETLDVIAYNRPNEKPPDIHDIPSFKKDLKIQQLLLEAKALGCFYVESPAMRMLMVKLKVQTYLELVAASSIIRPGVAQSGMMKEYILRHRNPERRKLANPVLLEIMPETYGVMVYQEDVIKVAHYFAGLSLAESDVLRRGMSGKFRSREEFTKVKDTFYFNCQTKGYSKELTQTVWTQIESFAGYAFSKGHSASYAVESYQSLFLKAHFPLEYMVATINNFGGYYRTEIYVHEARRFGATIEAPCVQEGNYPCVLFGNRIVLGFILVEGLEIQTSSILLNDRNENGPFQDFDDFLKRIRIPLDQLSLLIRVGALRYFNISRKEMLWKAHYLLYKQPVRVEETPLFSVSKQSFVLPQLSEGVMEIVFDQLDLLGFPLCNPFELLSEKLPNHTLAKDIIRSKSMRIEMYGYLVAIKKSMSSNGSLMYFGTFIDILGDTIDTVHFPEFARKFPFQGKGIYLLKGVITESFDYHSLEVGEMHKMRWMDDVRYRDIDSGKKE